MKRASKERKKLGVLGRISWDAEERVYREMKEVKMFIKL